MIIAKIMNSNKILQHKPKSSLQKAKRYGIIEIKEM